MTTKTSAFSLVSSGLVAGFEAFAQNQAEEKKAKKAAENDEPVALDPHEDARKATTRFSFASKDEALVFLRAYKAATDMRGILLVGEALKRERQNRIIGAMGARYNPGLPFGLQVDIALWGAMGLVCPERRIVSAEKKEGLKRAWVSLPFNDGEKEVMNLVSRLRVDINDSCEAIQDYHRSAKVQHFDMALKHGEKMVSLLLRLVRIHERLGAMGIPAQPIPWASFGLDNPDAQVHISEIALAIAREAGKPKAEQKPISTADLLDMVVVYMADEGEKAEVSEQVLD